MSMIDIQGMTLQAMRPGCFYRTTDIARELGVRTGQARYALVRLSRGGVVASEVRKGDRRRIYITKQWELILP